MKKIARNECNILPGRVGKYTAAKREKEAGEAKDIQGGQKIGWTISIYYFDDYWHGYCLNIFEEIIYMRNAAGKKGKKEGS